MTEKIKFRPTNYAQQYIIPPPKPAKLLTPEWYKKMSLFHGGKLGGNGHGHANTTGKACAPLLDSFTTGYIQETWCDILVERMSDESPVLTFYPEEGDGKILDIRRNSKTDTEFLEIPDGFDPIEFVWKTVWWSQTPKGWSTLYTHPLNRHDLPFVSFSGIVESDTFWGSGNYPFFLKKDFEGLIPVGTPMYQMIPIKRADWKSEATEYNEIEENKMQFKVQSYFYGGYKRLHWKKKNYS